MRPYAFVVLALFVANCNEPTKNNDSVSLTYSTGIDGFQHVLKISGDANTLLARYCIRPDTTININLTAGEIEAISQKAEEIDLFSYPDTFYATPQGRNAIMFTPCPIYKIEIEERGRSAKVYWSAGDFPSDSATQDAIDLRALFDLVDSTYTRHSEYKALPPLDCLFMKRH